MTRCDDLLEKARRIPAGLRFGELERLAECLGFSFSRQKGSHKVYKHERHKIAIPIQDDGHGMAKAYQVRQFLEFADEYLQGRE